ncbi:hypothetical protein BDF19DRAFT_432270 [Syncephalis fuscata]|nr:hypothetical protein BDF19DRAFT_432270 [Syncephalis fuscata]
MTPINGSTAYNTALENAKTLLKQKDEVEAEIRKQEALLNEHRVGMHEPLVDREGYPRADIDVYSARKIRVRIIELRNDLRDCMACIEKALHEPVLPLASIATASTIASKPFARVNAVSPDSPAWDAGLRRDDRILCFGDIDIQQYESLAQIGELVNSNEGRTINITVERLLDNSGNSWKHQILQLIPRKDWGGRGMLGCHIVPMED